MRESHFKGIAEKQVSIYLALDGVIVNYLRCFAANFQLFEQY